MLRDPLSLVIAFAAITLTVAFFVGFVADVFSTSYAIDGRFYAGYFAFVTTLVGWLTIRDRKP